MADSLMSTCKHHIKYLVFCFLYKLIVKGESRCVEMAVNESILGSNLPGPRLDTRLEDPGEKIHNAIKVKIIYLGAFLFKHRSLC